MSGGLGNIFKKVVIGGAVYVGRKVIRGAVKKALVAAAAPVLIAGAAVATAGVGAVVAKKAYDKHSKKKQEEDLAAPEADITTGPDSETPTADSGFQGGMQESGGKDDDLDPPPSPGNQRPKGDGPRLQP